MRAPDEVGLPGEDSNNVHGKKGLSARGGRRRSVQQ